RPPAKNGDIVGAPSWPATVEIEEGNRFSIVDMRIPAMKVAVTESMIKSIKREARDPLAQSLGDALEVGPVVGTMHQKRLDRHKRLIEEVLEIETEPAVLAY